MARPHAHPELDRFLLHLIAKPDRDLVATAARTFGLSRQAINGHLRELVRSGAVIAKGSTRSRSYALAKFEESRKFPLSGLAEHEVWEQFVRPRLASLPENVRAIAQYGVTEMINNAIDHSEGSDLSVLLILTPIQVQISIMDNGVGIFKKIRDAFALAQEGDVILELSKGKLTTDPARHTGEGVFFTSRIFDSYSLYSGSLLFHHFLDNDDWLVERGDRIGGTLVTMEIDPASTRTTMEVFDKFATPEQFRFDVTHVPVKLAIVGEDSLVSRSQAKRLVTRCEKFSRVILDFAGVSTIGQAFADEVFRVFTAAHPDVQLSYINASDEVLKMIGRVTTGDQLPLQT
jgi:anti-sigma regulatory factor (Ser/Thr protein kinase)